MSGHPDDDGITLVELLVYIVISGLVLGSLALMFASGLRAQTQATDRDSATGAGNVVSSSLLASIRNASEFTVIGGRSLIAKVATGGTDWECRAWALSDGELRYRSGDAALSTADTSEWGVIAGGVTGILAGGTAFAAEGHRTLSIGMEIVSGETTIVFDNGVTAQAVSDGTDSTACW